MLYNIPPDNVSAIVDVTSLEPIKWKTITRDYGYLDFSPWKNMLHV